ALIAQGFVGHGSLASHRFAAVGSRSIAPPPAVGLVARLVEHGVGALACLLDEGVCLVVDRADALGDRLVGVPALDAQALVGTVALGLIRGGTGLRRR